MTKEFCNKKKQICRVQQPCKRITARALFDSIEILDKPGCSVEWLFWENHLPTTYLLKVRIVLIVKVSIFRITLVFFDFMSFFITFFFFFFL